MSRRLLPRAFITTNDVMLQALWPDQGKWLQLIKDQLPAADKAHKMSRHPIITAIIRPGDVTLHMEQRLFRLPE